MDLLKLPFVHPISMEWKLKKSILETIKPNESWESEQYFPSKIAGVRYKLVIIPYGIDNSFHGTDYAFEGKALIGFKIQLGHVKEIIAKFEVSIESVNFCKNIENAYKEPAEAEVIVLCNADEFFDPKNNYFVNDELVITVNGTLKFDRPFVSKSAYPLSLKWKITAAELEPLKTSTDGYLQSHKLHIRPSGDVEYNLTIYPNGKEIHREIALISLELRFLHLKPIHAFTTVTINDGFRTEALCPIYEESDGIAFRLCSTEDLFDVTKGYLINGEMTITVEGDVLVDHSDFTVKLISDEEFSTVHREKNFKIFVGGEEINVNKAYLAEASPVLAGMLQSGMKEAIEGKMEISDFSYKTVISALRLLYDISPTLTLDDILPLLVFSDKYDIQFVKELVENRLIQEVCPSNVCQLIHFSNLFNAQKLYEKSVEYFRQCSHDKTAVTDLDLIDRDMFCKIFFPFSE